MSDAHTRVWPKFVTKDFLKYGYSIHRALLPAPSFSIENNHEQFNISGFSLHSVYEVFNVVLVRFSRLIHAWRVDHSKTATASDIV
jgi:hypothetical protein